MPPPPLKRASVDARSRTDIKGMSMGLEMELQAAKRTIEAVRKEKAAVDREVASLKAQRASEQAMIAECRKEGAVIKARLKRCREVVAVTVGSMDRMFSEARAMGVDCEGSPSPSPKGS
eukprot:TRINITY_DN56062_c0_g1_i1.p1 TRINITY_DN56062_c0_g1~~TRINITY_DN56062_c0_g1_i1.p1  ORF type:complete len:119 (+),score=26.60 TRINITY_DN56062_c0_g1_i1:72-428(+)